MQFIANTTKIGIRHALRRAQAKVIQDKILPRTNPSAAFGAAGQNGEQDPRYENANSSTGLLAQMLSTKATGAMRKALAHAPLQRLAKASSGPDLQADIAETPCDGRGAATSGSAVSDPASPAAAAMSRPAQDWLRLPDAQEDGPSDTKAATDRGQFLARQDRWDELLQELEEADGARLHLSNGSAKAELLAYGARCDVVNSLDHALREGCATDDQITLDGVMALERVRLELGRAPLMTAVVALAHIDFGWAFQTAARSSSQPESLEARAKAHFDRAATLLAETAPQAEDSPLVMCARCALFSGISADADTVAETYRALIAAAPQNPRHMRALGNHLLPRWHGSYARLEQEARKTAARTADYWGAAGYTWVYFDALALDPEASAHMDLDLFLDGFADIVERGADAADPNVDQETVNLLAAYCLVTLKSRRAPDAAAEAYEEIAESAHWLVRNHLQELHPMVWAHAERGFANNISVSSLRRFTDHGRQTAHAALATLFAAEIDAGHRVVFSPDGVSLEPAET